MRVETLLNHCYHHKSFVYSAVRWDRDGGKDTLIVDIIPRKNGLPVCSLCGTGVSLRALAERIQTETHWEDAQVIVAGTQGHGIEFYLQRFVDNTLTHADVALPLSPALAQRIHPSVEEIRYAPNGLPCFVVTKERNLRRGQFPSPEWKVLQQEGSFILLKHSGEL